MISQALTVSVLCISWIFVSYLLIAFNKYLMTDGGFPYAASLGLFHGVTCSSLALLLLLIKPSLFETLQNETKRSAINSRFMLTCMLPICVCFTIEIILGNQAYKFLSLAFLQMLKESNVVIVYVMALVAGMEKFSWTHLKLICLICFASAGTLKGELHFTMIGFTIQMLCCLAGSLKITLQGVLLNSQGMKFDALSYMILVMPVCSLIQGSLLFGSNQAQAGGVSWMPVPPMELVLSKWHLLLPNALLAFTLNVIAVLFIKASSSVTYVLAGIVKDMVIVVFGVLLAGDEVSSVQAMSFALQLMFLLIWSVTKMHPDLFEEGILPGLKYVSMGVKIPSGKEKGKDLAAASYGTVEKPSQQGRV
eukprot:TRINITY_DN46776_c0_g1_i1.p1 TRINITY_DN46776_c0_g1~~TRINITY_DN46776_c0_g1_i1.p1  ORF type:complete len:364 (-),score=77.40 TRINITY_DN46776_c0_g1_i1:92-1183(-)